MKLLFLIVGAALAVDNQRTAVGTWSDNNWSNGAPTYPQDVKVNYNTEVLTPARGAAMEVRVTTQLKVKSTLHIAPYTCDTATEVQTQPPTAVANTQCAPLFTCPSTSYEVTPRSWGVNATCQTCPVGYECDGTPLADSQKCGNDKKYSGGGLDSCETCLPGSYTSGGDSNTRTTCQECPAGWKCDGSSATPDHKCGDDSDYSAAGNNAGTCKTCGAGSYTSGAVDAALGHTHSTCSACPAGYSCNGTSIQTACGAGTYSGSGASSCSPCTGADKYSPGTSNSWASETCKTCLTASFTAGGSSLVSGHTTCTTCPAGYECDGTSQTDDHKCPAGQYSPGSLDDCHSCGWNALTGANMAETTADKRYSSSTGAQSCQTCQPGSYTSGGSGKYERTTCTECPEGYACDGTSDKTECPAGTFAAAGAATCSQCNNDKKYSPGTDVDDPSGYKADACLTCQSGSYTAFADGDNANKHSTCTACIEGHSCDGGSTKTACGNDKKYSKGTGNSACLTCQAASYTSGGDANTHDDCTACPAGDWCDGGASRTACPAGTFSAGSAANSCTDCANDDEYSPGTDDSWTASACKTCLTASYTSGGTDGTGAHTTCTECPEGYGCDGTSLQAVHKCNNDTKYSAGGLTTCETCLTGSYTSSVSSDDSANTRDTCTQCPAGWECDGTSLTADHKCGNDKKYSGLGRTTCLTCQAGSYTGGGTDSDTHTTCTACPVGFSCDGGSTQTRCQPGHHADGGESQCHPCGADNEYEVGATAAAQAQCETCQTASYTSGGTINTRTTCTICPAGYACDGTSKTPDHMCLAGEQSSEGSDTCSTCGADNKYSVANGTAVCSTCPQGSYTSSVNSVDSTNTRDTCLACPAGYSCDGTSTQTPCPAGTYMTGPSVVADFLVSGVHTCKDCGNDKEYATGTGNSACLTCQAGSYTTFGDGDNANKHDDCTACSEGHYCDGGSTQHECGDDKKYSKGTGNSACLTCQAASYTTFGAPPGASVDVNTHNDCTTCSAGSSCDGGSTKVTCPEGWAAAEGDGVCSRCGADNKYSSAGAPACSTCLTGSYTGSEGDTIYTNRTSCEICPQGYECPDGSSTINGCGPGYKAPTTGHSSCQECGSDTCAHTVGTLATSCYYSSGTANVNCVECGAGSHTEYGDAAATTSTTRDSCTQWAGTCDNVHGEPIGTLLGATSRRKPGHCASCPTGYTHNQLAHTAGPDQCLDQVDPSDIEIFGDNPEHVEADQTDTFTDVGANCTDFIDGEIACVAGGESFVVGTHSCGVVQSGPGGSGNKITSATTGSYTVTYSCKDRAGNGEITASRTVNVVDTTPPSLTVSGTHTSVYNVAAPADSTGAQLSQEAYADSTDYPTFSCSDSYDDAPVSGVNGTVDISQEGPNTLTYWCRDAGGNEVVVDRQITVKFTAIDGGWSEWAGWGVCSGSKPDSSKTRVRTCTNPQAQYGGTPCAGISGDNHPSETETCWNGGWSDWSTCSKKCNGGTKTRTCTEPVPHNVDERGQCGYDGSSATASCNTLGCVPSVPCQHLTCTADGGMIQVHHDHREHCATGSCDKTVRAGSGHQESLKHHCMWYPKGRDGLRTAAQGGTCECLCNAQHDVHDVNDARRDDRTKTFFNTTDVSTAAPNAITDYAHDVVSENGLTWGSNNASCHCARNYDPVSCTSDGLLYANPCIAECAQATGCAPPATTTGVPDWWTTTVAPCTDACPTTFDPYKCADGLTYSNLCEANCASAVGCVRSPNGVCPDKCRSYFDGCNTCSCIGGRTGACTKKACSNYTAPKCIDYDTTTTTPAPCAANYCNGNGVASGDQTAGCTCACDTDYSGDTCDVKDACTVAADCNGRGSVTGNRVDGCTCTCCTERIAKCMACEANQDEATYCAASSWALGCEAYDAPGSAVCTKDSKECSATVAVRRDPANGCEFFSCPSS